MPYNGSGTFTRIYNWVTDKNNAVKITASRMDAEFDGIATGLSTAITKDGQTTPTANIPMGGYKLTGLGDATAATDALNRQTADSRYVASSGLAATIAAVLDENVHATTNVASANTCDIGAAATDRVVITGTTTITSFGTSADRIRFVTFADALTLTYNATTLILPGLANITTAGGDNAIFASDGSGNWRCLHYDPVTGRPPYDPAATTAVQGKIELATNAETAAGTDTSRAVVPAALYIAEADVASAGTTDLGAVASQSVRITGTTTITSFGTSAAGLRRFGRFSGALTLTHNATSLILPGATDITTAAGDTFEALSLGSGNWVVTHYQKADGSSITAPASLSAASQAEQETASATNVYVTPGRQQYHPSAAKAWVKFNAAGTVAASYNVTSITDNAAGNWEVVIATDFSSANYCGVASAGDAVTEGLAGQFGLTSIGSVAAGTFQIYHTRVVVDAGGLITAIARVDPTTNYIFAAFYGDQA